MAFFVHIKGTSWRCCFQIVLTVFASQAMSGVLLQLAVGAKACAEHNTLTLAPAADPLHSVMLQNGVAVVASSASSEQRDLIEPQAPTVRLQWSNR